MFYRLNRILLLLIFFSCANNSKNTNVVREFTEEFPNNFNFLLPVDYKQYLPIFDWTNPQDSLLNSKSPIGHEGKKNIFLFRNDKDSSKVIIHTNKKFRYNECIVPRGSTLAKYYINGVYRKEKNVVIVEQKMQIFGRDTLLSIAYVFYRPHQNDQVMCYTKEYMGFINNVSLSLSYIRYTHKQELVDSVAANSDYVLRYFAKQMMSAQ